MARWAQQPAHLTTDYYMDQMLQKVQQVEVGYGRDSSRVFAVPQPLLRLSSEEAASRDMVLLMHTSPIKVPFAILGAG